MNKYGTFSVHGTMSRRFYPFIYRKTMNALPLFSVSLVLLLLSVMSLPAQEQELPRKPFLGVQIQTLTEALQQQHNLPSGTGVLVTGVIDKTSAQIADLRRNDIIVSLNGTAVRDVPHFLSLLSAYNTGDRLTFSLHRDSSSIEKVVELQPRPREQYRGVDVVYGTVVSGKNLLRTILTKPTSANAPVPVLYILQGVDCSSVDSPFSPDNTYARLVQYFSEKGFATFRVEKSGVGDSRGEPCVNMDFVTETRGFIDGLHYLKNIPSIDTNNVYLIGLSLGGITAPILASQEQVKGIVVYGTVLRPWSEYMLENMRRQSLLGGEDYATVETQSKQLAEAFHYIFADTLSPEETRSRHPELADIITSYLIHGSPADRPYYIAGRHYTFMRQLYETNIAEYWKKVKARVLVVWGKGDYVSDPDDHTMIVELINNYRPGKATYAEINADHWFGTTSSLQQSFRSTGSKVLPFTTEILPLIDNWIQSAN